MTAGWMTGISIKPAPKSNYWTGRNGQTVRATVLHIAEGSYAGSVDWLTNPVSGVSAHFMVGPAGEITQMVSILDTSYANGLSWINGRWVDPEGNVVSPRWPGLIPGVNPNFQTVSIEHAGHSGDVWTAAMIAADARILKFVATVYPMTWTVGDTLIGHRDISPVARAHCPGTGCPFDKIAAAANSTAPPLWSGPPGTYPVDLALKAYWERSGGIWQRDRYALGYALSPLINGIQRFERGRLRLKSDGTIEGLLLSELV